MEAFRRDTRAWLAENCPSSMRTRMQPGEAVNGGHKRRSTAEDAYLWLERMSARGWTAPTWPRRFGGADLDTPQFLILLQEMQRINARPPLLGMGISMLGPTLLEYGSEQQKLEHLPRIARGEVAWCQGYSEPGAGSDLASLQTRAADCGDHFLVNGSKIWTSGANHADWIFCLVRTDPAAPKHQGISFLIFSMDSPGVTTRPIDLINGASPFCQTFFNDVRVPKSGLVNGLNRGWEVAKRLLQHERSGLSALASAESAGPLERITPIMPLHELAQTHNNPAAVEPALRSAIINSEMQRQALLLSRQRAVEENNAQTPGAVTSIFNLVEADYVQAQLELQLSIRGTAGVGWQGPEFEKEALDKCRLWLESKAISIAGGSNEIQRNIIAKRVLGLPD